MKKSFIIFSSLIFVILFGLSFSPIETQGKGEPPDLEKIILVDKFKKSHIVPSSDPVACDDTSSSFKTFNGGLKWKSFPVKYHVDTSSFNDPDTTQSDAEAAVVRAFETWDAEDHGGDATNNFFEQTSSFAAAKIRFSWQSIDGEGETLGLATINFNSKSKTLNSATIILDSDDKWRVFNSLTCGDQSIDPTVLEFDIEDVAAHEIGHAIGFDHVSGKSSTYNTEYPYIIFEGETHKTTLGLGDKLGMESLYGNEGDNGGNGGGGKCPPGNPNHPKCN